MTRHAKVDAHHAEWLTMARQLGWSAQSTAMIGDGFPDAILAKAGRTLLVEFKTGNAALRPDQVTFHRSWRGEIAIVRSQADLVALLRVR